MIVHKYVVIFGYPRLHHSVTDAMWVGMLMWLGCGRSFSVKMLGCCVACCIQQAVGGRLTGWWDRCDL